MKIHFKGKYNLDPESLPHGEHQPNAHKFKEAKDSKQMAIIGNVGGFLLMILLTIPAYFRCRAHFDWIQLFIGCIVPSLLLFPHELLHAICFKEDAYIYTNFKQGILFVVGPETMSKGRFVFMSLLPNVLFGFLPYIVGMIFPQLFSLAVIGMLGVGSGFGDYYNVFNALTQMPKGTRTYLYQFNSYWYMPEK